MIDKVVVCGIRRANKLLPASDVAQMIGRAGRSFTRSGEAIILVPSDDCESADDILNKPSPPIISVMDEVDNVAFHVLPEIVFQRVNDEASFRRWYEKTLAFSQGNDIVWQDVVNYFIENGCICFFNEKVVASELGKVSSKFYFKPSRVKRLQDNLGEIVADGNVLNSHALSWCLAFDSVQSGQVDEYAIGEYKSAVSSLGYFFEGCLLHGYIYYCLLEGMRPKWLNYAINSEWGDFDRLIHACKKISELNGWEIIGSLETALLACKKRAGLALAGIMRGTGIDNKKLAYEMKELGIAGKEDFYKAAIYGSDELKKAITKSSTRS